MAASNIPTTTRTGLTHNYLITCGMNCYDLCSNLNKGDLVRLQYSIFVEEHSGQRLFVQGNIQEITCIFLGHSEFLSKGKQIKTILVFDGEKIIEISHVDEIEILWQN